MRSLYLSLRLYSQANLSFHQTSAYPFSPLAPREAPSVTATPFSNVYSAPVASCSAGVGWPRSRQRSIKCSWLADRSESVARDHLAMNLAGVISPNVSALVMAADYRQD